MNIDRIQFLTVPVSDLTEARDFYLGKLGFDLLVDVSGPHGPFVMVGPKGRTPGSSSSIAPSAGWITTRVSTSS
ncbi:VOC family protein [Amycolatopsis sp. EV170708-02-1]|nr:VOC family protein [Amycolatopsis sp. EV170708-02-1]UMP07742.1 VOC family protein [Amycolatopsis sp. EV170708-02-1]